MAERFVRNDVEDEGQDDLAWVEDAQFSVEDNDGDEEEHVDDSFQFPNQVCTMCEGYYGPCFGQHVCTTCHVFLFPDDINLPLTANNFSEVCLILPCCHAILIIPFYPCF